MNPGQLTICSQLIDPLTWKSPKAREPKSSELNKLYVNKCSIVQKDTLSFVYHRTKHLSFDTLIPHLIFARHTAALLFMQTYGDFPGCGCNQVLLFSPFLLWRSGHLHDRRAKEILQRHEEAGLQETTETDSSAGGKSPCFSI